MYSEKVMDHFQNPRNVGEIENASGVGTVGNAKCGDIMRIFLDIDDETHIIKDCKFKTFGCGAAVATSSMATEMVMGKTIEEAMEVTNKAVMEALDGLPPVKVHCSLLAEEAIHAALWDYAQKHHIEIKGLKKPKSDIHEGEEAEEEEKKGNHVTEVEGGYRRIVASPKPMDIVEIDAISALSDADQVVIACGGGGIPVLAQNNRLQGASAVIEKDLAAGKLADTLDADRLVILTSVDKVCLNYGKEDEKPLDTMTVDEAKKYLAAGEFDEGTMAPKIEAAIDFIGDSAIRSVLITKLNKEGKTVSGGMGTLITK